MANKPYCVLFLKDKTQRPIQEGDFIYEKSLSNLTTHRVHNRNDKLLFFRFHSVPILLENAAPNMHKVVPHLFFEESEYDLVEKCPIPKHAYEYLDELNLKKEPLRFTPQEADNLLKQHIHPIPAEHPLDQNTRDNIKIALFMGAKQQSEINPFTGRTSLKYQFEEENKTYLAEELQYHSSWEWLMPVFNKIQSRQTENHRFHFSIEPYMFELFDYETVPETRIKNLQYDDDWTLLEQYYDATTTFINWYKPNKPQ
jgi:hypothetical protein